MFRKKYTAKYTAPQPQVKKSKTGTIVFYSIYFVCVAAILAGILLILSPLEQWLTRYQASQPEEKCQEVFSELFSQPDWKKLYALAQVEDTPYEGADAYAAYMTEKVGSRELVCTETSAGLSGNHKYIVRLEGERIASFLLTPQKADEEGIVHWQLGNVELFFKRSHAVTVEKLPEDTVYINGVPLDDSHTVRYTDTVAEDYLPEGVHGYRRVVQKLEELLTQPEIVVKDAAGTELVMTENEEGILVPMTLAPAEMTPEEEKMAIGAAQAYALYSIRAINTGELRQHFDKNSEIYNSIRKTPVFAANYLSYSFQGDILVTDFFRYSEDCFSARVSLTLKIHQSESYTKTHESAITYFFSRMENGEFRVTDITNIPVLQQRTQVRITCIQDGQVLQSTLVAADASSMTLPTVTAPAGKVLQGWAVQTLDEQGKVSLTVRYIPDESGTVRLAGDAPLEPVTLYPVFISE